MYSYPLGTLSPLRTHHQLLLLPIEYLLSRRHTVPPPTTLQVTSTPQRPLNPTIWSLPPAIYCLQAIPTTTPNKHNKHFSILLGSINDHINPRHRLTIPKHLHQPQHNRNNEEIPPHPINHHPTLNQPPTLLQLHLNRRNSPLPLALQPPLSKHRRPQHPLPSCLSRSFASPLKHHSQRQSPQHPGARVTDVDDGAQTQLGRLRAPARRLHLVPGLRRDQR
jgi:hypothetical protein